jgi:hypothetical protein
MPLARAEPTSIEEFLAREHRQDFRYEFDNARPIATTGGTAEHTAIAPGLGRAVDDRLKPGRAGSADRVVTCSTTPRGSDANTEPLTIFGVLSISTELIDRNAQADDFGAPRLLGRDVKLAQTAVEAAILPREGDAWAHGRPSGRDAIFKRMEFNVALPLAEVYRRTVLDD